MKKETPMLFSTPMVQAILEGRKTMTRRVVKELKGSTGVADVYHRPDGRFIGTHLKVGEGCGITDVFKCPYGNVGDLIWVRETFYVARSTGDYEYKADRKHCHGLTWKPSIYVPKAAARIWLEITDIRVERLHDISTADIKAEGVQVPVSERGNVLWKVGEGRGAISFMPADQTTWTEDQIWFAHWAELWVKINGIESWNSNPWVWAVEFKRIKK